MSQAVILKEYLLSLGFKIDERSTKKFDEGVGKLDLGAAGLAKRMLGAAAAAQALVAVFAASMEKLYYASKRTDSTVTNIQALEYAGRQIGLSGEQMRGSLESMTRALRSNPGLVGLLQDLGVEVKGRDKSDVMTDLVEQLGKMPFYVASQYAGLFGIGPDELLMMQQGLGEMKRLREERRAMAKEAGFDADKAAESAKDYANALRQVQERLGLLKDIVATAMLPYFKEFTTQTIKALDALNRWLGNAKPLKDQAKEVQANTGKAATSYWDFTKKFWSGVTGGAQKPGAGAGQEPLGLRNNNPGNLRSWGNTPTAGGFAKFDSPDAGLSAMAGNLLAYYKKYGLDTITGIVKRWAPPNENNTSAYIKSLVDQTGFGADSKLNLEDPQVLAALMAGITKHENGRNPFSQTQLLGVASSRLGGAQVNQTNVFHIAATDPDATARAVNRDLGTANATLTRNLAGVIE